MYMIILVLYKQYYVAVLDSTTNSTLWLYEECGSMTLVILETAAARPEPGGLHPGAAAAEAAGCRAPRRALRRRAEAPACWNFGFLDLKSAQNNGPISQHI